MARHIHIHLHDDFEEEKHPRGQPDNPGQFARKGSGGTRSPTAQKQLERTIRNYTRSSYESVNAELRGHATEGYTPPVKQNRKKVEMAIARKHEVVAQMAKEVGRPLNPKTIGIILDPNTGIADVHVLDGFHADVNWNSPAVKSAYKGSFRYATEAGSRRLPKAA